MSPTTAFHVLQGLETLPIRMDKHVANTREVVAFLEAHEAVESVSYPELPSHPDHDLSARLLPKGAGAVFSFEIKGGRDAGRTFIENLSIFSHLANVGDAKSLVIHPASTTHHRMDAEALAAAGIGEGLVRLSIGLEDPDDLIGDLSRALRRATRDTPMSGTRIRVDGRTVYVGNGSGHPDSAAESVVFVHGAGMDHTVWALPARYFARQGLRVAAVDLPGHGRSEGPPFDRIDAMAAWLGEALDALAIPTASVVGHSMGSLVAYRFASTMPHRLPRPGFARHLRADAGYRHLAECRQRQPPRGLRHGEHLEPFHGHAGRQRQSGHLDAGGWANVCSSARRPVCSMPTSPRATPSPPTRAMHRLDVPLWSSRATTT